MADFVQPISFNTPSPYSADLDSIQRRMALAKSLQGQALDPVQGNGAPMSWTQGAAKLAQAWAANRQQQMGQQEMSDLAGRYEGRRSADIAALVNAMGGRPASPGGLTEDAAGNVTHAPALPGQSPQQALSQVLPMLQDPALQQAGFGMLNQYALANIPKKPEPYTLKPGEERRGPNNELLAVGPAEKPQVPQAYTLAPGHERRGPNNELIARAPDKPAEQTPVTPVTVIDENGRAVVKDGRTGRVLGLSPQDPKLAGAFNADTAALQGTTASMDRLAGAANQLLQHPGLAGIVGIRGKFPNMPGSAAADAEALLNTLKSQVAFGVLQDMRNTSKTGGALGNVSDAEGRRLEANLAALEKAQSLPAMKSSLQAIIEYSEGAKDRMRDAFNMKHGGKGGLPTRPGEAPQPAAAPKAAEKKGNVVDWSELGRTTPKR